MKRHMFRGDDNIEAIALDNGFRLVETIWNDGANSALRERRQSPYALLEGDVIVIPDKQVRVEPSETTRRHVFQLLARARPVYYSRLDNDVDQQPGKIAPVFAKTGATGIDVSFLPQIAGAIRHVARSPDLRYRALIAGRLAAAEPLLGASCAKLLRGEKAAWVADARGRHEARDIQLVLTWAANARGYPCDPAAIDNDFADASKESLRHFRVARDIIAKDRALFPDKELRPDEDLAAFYDLLDEHLLEACSLTRVELDQVRGRIALASPGWADFSSFDPIANGPASRTGMDVVLFEEQVYTQVSATITTDLGGGSAFYFLPMVPQVATSDFEPLIADVLDIEEAHFGIDRYVLLPTELQAPPAGDEWGLGGLDVLVAALLHAKDHPTRKLLVTGHTDTPHSGEHNLELSLKRANNVFYALSGYTFAEEWIALSHAGGTRDDIREILRFIDERFAYGCAPSPRGKPSANLDALALRAFHTRYNEDVASFLATENPFAPGFSTPVPAGGLATKDTWRAFFDLYQRYLAARLKLTMNALGALQFGVNTMSPVTQGCGEYQTLDLEERLDRQVKGYPELTQAPNATDRRVELIFFDSDEASAVLDFPCHPTQEVKSCKPELCVLYDQAFWKFRRLTLEPEEIGKLTLTRRAVERATLPAGYAPPTVTVQENGDYCPRLDKNVIIDVSVEVPRQPFQGKVELVISRRTDAAGVFSRVAVLEHPIVHSERALDVTFLWDGKATLGVPPHYSDREVVDLNQDKMVHVPVRELVAGEPVHHGVYVIERVTLLEKDGSVAGDLRPDLELQDKFAIVAEPLVELLFDGPIWRPLYDVGFGEEIYEEHVPFVQLFAPGVLSATKLYYSGRGIRFVATIGQAFRTTGMRVSIFCHEASLQSAPSHDGGTFGSLKSLGLSSSRNLFCWSDDAKDGLYSRVVWAELFRRNAPTSPREHRRAFEQAFGPIGFPADKCWVITKKISGGEDPQIPDMWPTLPRVVDGVDVTGCVTKLDEANVIAALGVDGMPSVRTTNTRVVPDQRAADIQRALRAVIGHLAQIAAHEIGHLVGIATSLLKRKPGANFQESEESEPAGGIEMPDGTVALPPLAQDLEGHDTVVTATGLMVVGERQPLAQCLRLSGPVRRFNADQQAHANVLFPTSAEVVTQ